MTISTFAHVPANITSQPGMVVAARKAQAQEQVPGSDRAATLLESALALVLAAHRQGPTTEMLRAKAAVLVLE